MLGINLVRTVLCEYDDIYIENFINEHQWIFNIDIDENEIENEIKGIIQIYEEWLIYDHHLSVFKWNGQYWKDGEKKLEYIDEIHYNERDIYHNVDIFINKNIKSLKEFKNLYYFDLTTGNPDYHLNITSYIIRNT